MNIHYLATQKKATACAEWFDIIKKMVFHICILEKIIRLTGISYFSCQKLCNYQVELYSRNSVFQLIIQLTGICN